MCKAASKDTSEYGRLYLYFIICLSIHSLVPSSFYPFIRSSIYQSVCPFVRSLIQSTSLIYPIHPSTLSIYPSTPSVHPSFHPPHQSIPYKSSIYFIQSDPSINPSHSFLPSNLIHSSILSIHLFLPISPHSYTHRNHSSEFFQKILRPIKVWVKLSVTTTFLRCDFFHRNNLSRDDKKSVIAAEKQEKHKSHPLQLLPRPDQLSQLVHRSGGSYSDARLGAFYRETFISISFRLF